MGKYDDRFMEQTFQTKGRDQLRSNRRPQCSGHWKKLVNAVILNCIVHHNGNTGIAATAEIWVSLP